jgi:hypothetical protein
MLCHPHNWREDIHPCKSEGIGREGTMKEVLSVKDPVQGLPKGWDIVESVQQSEASQHLGLYLWLLFEPLPPFYA